MRARTRGYSAGTPGGTSHWFVRHRVVGIARIAGPPARSNEDRKRRHAPPSHPPRPARRRRPRSASPQPRTPLPATCRPPRRRSRTSLTAHRRISGFRRPLGRGDNHLSWSPAAGDTRAVAGRVAARAARHRVAVTQTPAPADLQLCGYPRAPRAGCAPTRSRPADGVLRAACAGERPVRLVPLRLRPPREQLNRWHVMDLERSRSCRCPPGAADGVGQPLGHLPEQACQPTPNCRAAPTGSRRRARPTTQLAGQADAGARTRRSIPVRPSARSRTAREYQIVTSRTRYRPHQARPRGIGSVRCVTVTSRARRARRASTTTVAGPEPGDVPTCRTSLDRRSRRATTRWRAPTPCRLCALPERRTAGPSRPVAAQPTRWRALERHRQPRRDASTAVAAGRAAIPAAIAATGRRRRPHAGAASRRHRPRTPTPVKQPQSATAARRRLAVDQQKTALRKVFGRGLSAPARDVPPADRRPPRPARCPCASAARATAARCTCAQPREPPPALAVPRRRDAAKNGRTTHVRRDYRTGGIIAAYAHADVGRVLARDDPVRARPRHAGGVAAALADLRRHDVDPRVARPALHLDPAVGGLG